MLVIVDDAELSWGDSVYGCIGMYDVASSFETRGDGLQPTIQEFRRVAYLKGNVFWRQLSDCEIRE